MSASMSSLAEYLVRKVEAAVLLPPPPSMYSFDDWMRSDEFLDPCEPPPPYSPRKSPKPRWMQEDQHMEYMAGWSSTTLSAIVNDTENDEITSPVDGDSTFSDSGRPRRPIFQTTACRLLSAVFHPLSACFRLDEDDWANINDPFGFDVRYGL